SVAHRYALIPPGNPKTISVEHPSGEFSVVLSMNAANPTEVLQAALLRTARLIMRGEERAARRRRKRGGAGQVWCCHHPRSDGANGTAGYLYSPHLPGRQGLWY